jgi:peptidoglycan/LPS O-acetylase OafA/YrhL
MDYRREIDGLRAVAVLPVILFHAGVGAFSGGFVGVDVFFVISGYLITTILLAEMATGRFSFAQFYERRARRILPALFVVMAACIPFAWVWMPPAMFEDFARSLGLAALSLSNFWFARETAYFSPAAELQPLLHTWSLAVEEQYYLLFPPLLLLMCRLGPRAVLGGLVALSLASLALAIWGGGHDPSRNFYFTPSRLWELGAGSLCAVALAGRGPGADDRLALPGLGLILGAVVLFDHETPTPGLWTLVPVLGTVLIVLFGGAGSLTARVLALRPLVAVGLISYSVYLWHQPLFALARLQAVQPPSPAVMLGLAGLALLLAWATWAWVEQPFRRRPVPLLPARGRLFGAAGAAVVAAVAFGVLADNSAWWDRRLSPEQRQLLAYQTYFRTPAFDAAYRHPDCFFTEDAGGLAAFRPDLCLALDDARPNVLLIGDSHAAHLWHGLVQVLPQVNFMQVTTAGCRPLDFVPAEPDCVALMTLVWDEFLPRNAARIDTILLAARWRNRDVAALGESLNWLARFGVSLVVLGPVAEFVPDVPVLLSRLTPGADADAVLAGFLNQPRLAVAARIADQARAAGVPYVDVLAAQCGADLGACPAFAAEGVPVVWDHGHFTAEGSALMVARLIARDPAMAALAARLTAAP